MIRTGLLLIAVGVGLYLAWQIAGTLLLLFSGLLLAAVLDAGVQGLGKIMPVGRAWRLLIVCLIAATVIAALLVIGGYNVWQQFEDLWDLLVEGGEDLIVRLEDWGVPLEVLQPENGGLPDWLPDTDNIFGHAGTAFGLTMGILSDIVVMVLLAIFLALNPQAYRDGVLKLVPIGRRARMGEVLDKTGSTLKWWLVAQLAMMVLIAVSTAILLTIAGLPYAIPLALVAGLLNFIPFLGPILATVPIVLALVPEGMFTLVWVVAVFTVLQWIEGYFISPLIQQRIVHLPPALSLAFLSVMAALFGGIGIALATPLLAVLRTLVLELYVKDVLEKPRKPQASELEA